MVWYGLSSFEIQIPKENPIHGLALRSSNIQLGTNSVFRNNFNDPRSCFYFVGEVFAVSKGLRPNARRDYFNPSETLNEFIREIEAYFNDELRKIFNKANDIKNYYRDINLVEKKKEEHQQNLTSGKYLGDKDREKAEEAVKEAEIKAEKAMKSLEKVSNYDPETPMAKVAENIKKRHGTAVDTSTKPSNPVVSPLSSTPENQGSNEIKIEDIAEFSDKSEVVPDQKQEHSTADTEKENSSLPQEVLTPATATSLPPKKDGITPPVPLPMEQELLAVDTINESKPVVYFYETLTKLKTEEREILREVLEMMSSTLKEKELEEIKEKIKKKWN